MEHSDPILEVLIMACRKPGMYGLDFRYESVVHFLNGAHAGGTALEGFDEWVTSTEPVNEHLPWWVIIRRRVVPHSEPIAALSPADTEALLTALAQELTDYRNCRRRGGIGAVYARFLERFPLAYKDPGPEE